MTRLRAVFVLLAAVLLPSMLAAPEAEASRLGKDDLRTIRIDQKLDEQVPLDLTFHEGGRSVALADIVGDKPVVLALIYNRCPMLCNQVLQGLLGALKVLELSAGPDFDILAVSFDPEEDPATAVKARNNFLKHYPREDAATGVHFLTGEAPAIAALTDAVGFRYEYDEDLGQWAHAAALVVLTPEGKVARYFFGTEYSPRDMRLALREASDGKVGSVTDDLLLLCYRYDPVSGTYSATVVNAIRVGGLATLLALALFIGRSLRRERTRKREVLSEGEAG